jgi:hypothetical protein
MRTGSVSVEHSRALLLAQSATSAPPGQLEQHLDSSVVAISIDPDLPMSFLTARVLVSTLRRGLGTLVLLREGLPGHMVHDLEETAAAIDPSRPLRIETVLPGEPAVRLHIGTSVTGRAVRVVPEGYGAHIATARTAVIRPSRPGNELGAAYAAALAAAEAFKHTAAVLPARRVLHRHLRFCPVTLSAGLSAAPPLPAVLTMGLSLIGVGAIGTGIVLVLSELPAEGKMLAVDRQRFAKENRGTYALGGVREAQANPWKTDIAQQALHRFDVEPFRGPVENLPAAVDAGEAPWFPTVLTALDSPEARRDAQRLWPDRLIDAATGDTMLGMCDHRAGLDPCLVCHFPIDRDQPSGTERIAQRLGLPAEVLGLGDEPLTEEHLSGLTEDQRAFLWPHLGMPICGLARAAGLTGLDQDGFMPSVPFVSLQAACLAVGRLLAVALGSKTTANFVQYDGLFGPQAATIGTFRRRPGCICMTRSDSIGRVRQERRARPLR